MADRIKIVPLEDRALGIKELQNLLGVSDRTGVAVIMLPAPNSEYQAKFALAAESDANPGTDLDICRVVEQVLGRAMHEAVPEFASDDLKIDISRRKIVARGRPVQLSRKEFELLRHLVALQGRPLEHRYLLQQIWGPGAENEIENLRVLVSQLRRKIEADPAKPKYIHTSPGYGYCFEPVADEANG